MTYSLIRLALRDQTTMAGDQSSPHEAKQKLPGGEPTDEQDWLDVIKYLYYDSSGDTDFGSYGKLLHKTKTLPAVEPSEMKPWLEQQDVYTLHKPVQKRFPRNPYIVSNIFDVFEADLIDVQSLAKYHDKQISPNSI